MDANGFQQGFIILVFAAWCYA